MKYIPDEYLTFFTRWSWRFNVLYKKSLKIQIGQSESVNQRTDNSVQKKKNKKTNNDLQSITYKTEDPAIQTQLKQGVSSGAPEGLAVPAPLVTPIVLI